MSLSQLFSLLFAKLKALFCSFQAIFRPISIPGIRAFSTRGSTGAAVSGQTMAASDNISYLTQREAAEIDETLMGPLGFSVDQLMVSLHRSDCLLISPLVG